MCGGLGLRQIVVRTNLIIFAVAFLGFPAGFAQEIKTASGHLPIELQRAALRLELNRAILVLRQGIGEKWEFRDQYLAAFEKTPNADLEGRSVQDQKRWVGCVIGARLRVHQVWDEGAPIEVEVNGVIAEFTRDRESRSIETLFLP
jgi:hypothetical protein